MRDQGATSQRGHRQGGTGGLAQGARGGGGVEAWAEQLKKECAVHTGAALLAVRAELMALLEDLSAVVRVVSALC